MIEMEVVTPKYGKVKARVGIYPFGDLNSICIRVPKQKYYFRIEDEPNEENILKFFNEFKDNPHGYIHTGKCIRCSKWNVVDGVYCNRCKEAMNSNTGNTELDVQI